MPGCVVYCRGLGACAGIVSVRGGAVVVWVPPRCGVCLRLVCGRSWRVIRGLAGWRRAQPGTVRSSGACSLPSRGVLVQ